MQLMKGLRIKSDQMAGRQKKISDFNRGTTGLAVEKIKFVYQKRESTQSMPLIMREMKACRHM